MNESEIVYHGAFVGRGRCDMIDWSLARFHLSRQSGNIYDPQGQIVMKYEAVLTKDDLDVPVCKSEPLSSIKMNEFVVLWFYRGVRLHYDVGNRLVHRMWLILPKPIEVMEFLVEKEMP